MPGTTLEFNVTGKIGDFLTATEAAKAAAEKASTDIAAANLKANSTLVDRRALLAQEHAAWVQLRDAIKATRQESSNYEATLQKMAQRRASPRELEIATDQAAWSARYAAAKAASATRSDAEKQRVQAIVDHVERSTMYSMSMNPVGGAKENFFTRWFSKLSGTGSGSAAQLVSVVSNTASSLASGMSPMRIMAQQLPNVLQALVMFGDDLVAIGKRVLFFFINPITLGVGAALAAIGTAAYKLHHYFTTLNATVENAGNRFGLANRNAADYATALESAAAAARAFHDWQVQLAKSLDTVAEKTQLAIEKLHEQTKAQQDLARAKGASPEQLARMETDALKAELQLLRQARAEQEAKNKEAVASAEALQKKLVSKSQFENAQDTAAANRTKEQAQKRLDEAIAAASKATGSDYFALLNQIRTSGADSAAITWQRSGMPGVAGPVDRMVETTAGALLKSMENQQVEAGGTFTTIAAARNALRDATKTEEDLTAAKENLTKELQAQQQAASSGKSALHTFDQQIARLENQLGVRAAYPFAAGGNRASADLTANQRIGAFSLSTTNPQVQLVSNTQLTAQNTAKTAEKLDQLLRDLATYSIY